MGKDNSPEDEKLTSGRHISYWTDSIAPIAYSPLKENQETDVVIVGGGLGGLSVAYCLLRAGKKIILVEDGFIGSGETGRTTAHLVTALDDRYYDLENNFSEEDIKLIADSHSTAIDFIEQTVKKENIECDFERLSGYLFLHPSDEKESLKKELDAALRAGINVEMLDRVPGLSEELQSIHFKEQAQFHPMKYLQGLCKAIEQMGGRLFTETHASEIHPWGIVSDKGYEIKSNYIVVASNSPVNSKYIIPLKQTAYRTYVIGALIKKEIVPRALWWDTGDYAISSEIPPYHYVRLQKYNDTHDILICGGEDHPIGDPGEGERASPENRYILLESWARKYFPIENIIYRWSGQVMEPMDGLAYIGHNPFDKDNVFIVTGDSGNGMTHCTIAGLLITDLITGKKNKWQNIYKPSRFIFKASGPFFQMLKGTVMDVLKKLSFDKEAEELSAIKIGEGKVVKLFGEKCGAFRDENDYLHLISAECTHLGCTVTWNTDEQSWDCPCHGSRFTYKGKVINGPANKDLPTVSESEALESRIEQTKFVVG